MNAPSATAAPAKASRVYLIDASVYVFRAFFSLPETMVNAEGAPINAIHGFASFLSELKRKVDPEAVIAVAFDESLSTSFRNRLYPEYKANRPPAPEGLKWQFEVCRDLCEALGLLTHSDEEYEADDIIGHWAGAARSIGHRVTVVSRDKDLTQLIHEGDTWWDFASDRHLTPSGVRDKMGVWPHQVADWLAFTGDSVDNIPGVKGVGPKAATALLEAFASLDEVYQQLDRVAELPVRGASSLMAKLVREEAMARLSLQLTRIPESCPRVPALDAVVQRADAEAVESILSQHGLGAGVANRLRAFS